MATKRPRYTLELFRDCYGPGLEARLEALRQVQQALGDLNDSAASRELLKKSMGSPAQGAREQARQFRQHWAEVFDARGRE